MRLTVSQKRLLCLAHQAEGWMEVFSKEGRTVASLEFRGLVVVHSDRRSLVLTDLGNQIAAPVKAGWKPITAEKPN